MLSWRCETIGCQAAAVYIIRAESINKTLLMCEKCKGGLEELAHRTGSQFVCEPFEPVHRAN